ncbi:c-type cytochrome [Actinomadura alba]|uniref:Cytochrome bc1 complex cytochrome c subunit n=1 Tax=Actinomadura alba TaxID=406431 RepID=A0ABR7LL14_9ACTN|nr:c-type cytochrome [Actinomadura alba]MBC6465378.1 c-type cytochrome [Actinomadura alba]
MKRFTAWRRRPWAGYAVVLVALATTGVVYAGFSPKADTAEASNSAAAAQDMANGKQLFNQNCSSCHGLNAQGTKDEKGRQIAPSLIGVGAASVDFQVSTGRMPAMNPGAQMPRKKPVEVFRNPKNVADVAAYVQSLGGGPTIPAPEQVDPEKGDVALGGKLFRTNCAQCHNFAGSGGALTGGKYAPPLDESTPTQIYEAMLTGPYAMPLFNDTTLTPEAKRAIIAYVVQTREEPNPGGNGLGRIGPVAEGIAGWTVGMGLLVLAAMWITARKPKKQHD